MIVNLAGDVKVPRAVPLVRVPKRVQLRHQRKGSWVVRERAHTAVSEYTRPAVGHSEVLLRPSPRRVRGWAWAVEGMLGTAWGWRRARVYRHLSDHVGGMSRDRKGRYWSRPLAQEECLVKRRCQRIFRSSRGWSTSRQTRCLGREEARRRERWRARIRRA